MQQVSTSLREDKREISRKDPLRVTQELIDHLYFLLRYLLKSVSKPFLLKACTIRYSMDFQYSKQNIWGLCLNTGKSGASIKIYASLHKHQRKKWEHCEMLGLIAETNQNKKRIQFLTFRHLPSVAILYCTWDISQKGDQITHGSIIKLKVC